MSVPSLLTLKTIIQLREDVKCVGLLTHPKQNVIYGVMFVDGKYHCNKYDFDGKKLGYRKIDTCTNVGLTFHIDRFSPYSIVAYDHKEKILHHFDENFKHIRNINMNLDLSNVNTDPSNLSFALIRDNNFYLIDYEKKQVMYTNTQGKIIDTYVSEPAMTHGQTVYVFVKDGDICFSMIEKLMGIYSISDELTLTWDGIEGDDKIYLTARNINIDNAIANCTVSVQDYYNCIITAHPNHFVYYDGSNICIFNVNL